MDWLHQLFVSFWLVVHHSLEFLSLQEGGTTYPVVCVDVIRHIYRTAWSVVEMNLCKKLKVMSSRCHAEVLVGKSSCQWQKLSREQRYIPFAHDQKLGAERTIDLYHDSVDASCARETWSWSSAQIWEHMIIALLGKAHFGCPFLTQALWCREDKSVVVAL